RRRNTCSARSCTRVVASPRLAQHTPCPLGDRHSMPFPNRLLPTLTTTPSAHTRSWSCALLLFRPQPVVPASLLQVPALLSRTLDAKTSRTDSIRPVYAARRGARQQSSRAPE